MSSSPDVRGGAGLLSPDAAVPGSGERPFLPGAVPGPCRSGGSGRADGFVAGYAAGYSEGLRRASAAVAARDQARADALAREQEDARARVGEVLQQLRAGLVRLQEDSWVDTVDLAQVVAECAATLARGVVMDAAPSTEALLGRLRRALEQTARPGEAVTVDVAPQSVRVLERAGVLPDGLPTGVVVVADPHLSDGDVVVRSGATTVSDLLVPAVEAAVAALTGEPA